MDINELAKEVHANAVEKGFWDKELSNEHCLCLVVTELSEAVEAFRKDRVFDKLNDIADFFIRACEVDFKAAFEHYIKDTVEDELADAFIRLLDLYGAREKEMVEYGIDKCLMGDDPWICLKGDSFTESVFSIIRTLTRQYTTIGAIVHAAMQQIAKLAERKNIDLEWHIKQKMRYNTLRERMHGKNC